MLATTAKTKRLLEVTQIVLSFASVCAVVDASRLIPAGHHAAGYHASVPAPRETDVDRRLGDLARSERQRREAAQIAARRHAGTTTTRLTAWTV